MIRRYGFIRNANSSNFTKNYEKSLCKLARLTQGERTLVNFMGSGEDLVCFLKIEQHSDGPDIPFSRDLNFQIHE